MKLKFKELGDGESAIRIDGDWFYRHCGAITECSSDAVVWYDKARKFVGEGEYEGYSDEKDPVNTKYFFVVLKGDKKLTELLEKIWEKREILSASTPKQTIQRFPRTAEPADISLCSCLAFLHPLLG